VPYSVDGRGDLDVDRHLRFIGVVVELCAVLQPADKFVEGVAIASRENSESAL
jgi:hypothetical protein